MCYHNCYCDCDVLSGVSNMVLVYDGITCSGPRMTVLHVATLIGDVVSQW